MLLLGILFYACLVYSVVIIINKTKDTTPVEKTVLIASLALLILVWIGSMAN